MKDEASAALVTVLFRGLRVGKAPDIALQEAQRAVRKTWPHLYYWAGFVSTGTGSRLKPQL